MSITLPGIIATAKSLRSEAIAAAVDRASTMWDILTFPLLRCTTLESESGEQAQSEVGDKQSANLGGRELGPSRRRYPDLASVADRRKLFEQN